MMSSSSVVVAAAIVAAMGITWMIFANARALAWTRVSLLPGRAPLLARVAWILSVLAGFTGPLVVIVATVTLVLGWWLYRGVLRGEQPGTAELPALMALRNSAVWWLIAAVLFFAFLWA